jgi:hypothetical protein
MEEVAGSRRPGGRKQGYGEMADPESLRGNDMLYGSQGDLMRI